MSSRRVVPAMMILLTMCACRAGDDAGVEEDDTDSAFDTEVCRSLSISCKLEGVQSDVGRGRLSRTAGFVYDETGRLITADREGRIVRFSSEGAMTVVAEDTAKTPRGMALLATGALVVVDSHFGRLVKIRPDGAVVPLAANLDFPFGVALDRDDTVFVSEYTGGAVSAVHPASGAVERIVDGLRFSPTGIAFSPDFMTLYLTADRDGAVYALRRGEDGRFGDLERIVAVPGTDGGCPEGFPESVCNRRNSTTPRQGAVSCLDAENNDACMTQFGEEGRCIRDTEGNLACVPLGWCDGMASGDPCVPKSGATGVCRVLGDGTSYCVEVSACYRREAGDDCVTRLGIEGVCRHDEDGDLACRVSPPCEGLVEGETCLDPVVGQEGHCIAGAFGVMCLPDGNACSGKALGDACVHEAADEAYCVSADGRAPFMCLTSEDVGRLSGIAVDKCGHLYVSDQGTGSIYRIYPGDGTLALLMQIPHRKVTALQVRGEQLFVGVEGVREVFAIARGGPGAPLRTGESLDDAVTVPDIPKISSECIELADTPLAVTELDAPRAYHDVAFDDDGYLIGYDGFSLVRVDREDTVELFSPGLGIVEGMARLRDGTLVAATDVGLVAVLPSGAAEVIVGDIFAFGVTVGPDDLIYAADNERVYRVEPVSGDVSVYLDPSDYDMSLAPRQVAFDPDLSVMYLTTFKQQALYVTAVDSDLTPVGRPRLFTVIPGSGYHDGLGVDICGNLYVPDYTTSSLYRISADGIVKQLIEWEEKRYGHGLEWGTGIGGWDPLSIYMPQPYDDNTVVEVNLGVGSAVTFL